MLLMNLSNYFFFLKKKKAGFREEAIKPNERNQGPEAGPQHLRR
jgi:hypothetical protein